MLYAPLVRTPEEVAEVVRVAGKLPVNVLVGWPGFTRRQLEDLGVKRISSGGALASRRLGRVHARARKTSPSTDGSTPSPDLPAAKRDRRRRSADKG